MLAEDPSYFFDSLTIQPITSDDWAPRAPYFTTNRGMAFQTVLGAPTESQWLFTMPLRCYDVKHKNESGRIDPLAVYLCVFGPQEYKRGYNKMAQDPHRCEEQLLDRKAKCFVGKEEQIYVRTV